MAEEFYSNGLDPLVGTEVVDLLGLKSYELNSPKTFSKVKEIVDFFGKYEDRRYQILKTLSGKQGDKLDILWTFVALQKEKQQKVKSLDASQFETDIEAELKKGILSRDSRKRIKEDITRKKKDLERQKKLEQAEMKYEKQKTSVVDKALAELQGVEDVLEDLSFIDKQLEPYG